MYYICYLAEKELHRLKRIDKGSKKYGVKKIFVSKKSLSKEVILRRENRLKSTLKKYLKKALRSIYTGKEKKRLERVLFVVVFIGIFALHNIDILMTILEYVRTTIQYACISISKQYLPRIVATLQRACAAGKYPTWFGSRPGLGLQQGPCLVSIGMFGLQPP